MTPRQAALISDLTIACGLEPGAETVQRLVDEHGPSGAIDRLIALADAEIRGATNGLLGHGEQYIHYVGPERGYLAGRWVSTIKVERVRPDGTIACWIRKGRRWEPAYLDPARIEKVEPPHPGRREEETA